MKIIKASYVVNKCSFVLEFDDGTEKTVNVFYLSKGLKDWLGDLSVWNSDVILNSDQLKTFNELYVDKKEIPVDAILVPKKTFGEKLRGFFKRK